MRALTTAAVLLATATPAAAAAPTHRHRDVIQVRAAHQMTFDGSCTFSGIVRFQPPMTDTPQTVTDIATASGSCSGTLTDASGHSEQLSSAPVGYQASDQGSAGSCALSLGATGSGELIFPSGKLEFDLSESRVAALATLSLTGRTGGSALGEANVNTNADPVLAVQDCTGPGLPQAPVDIRLQTTPTISG